MAIEQGARQYLRITGQGRPTIKPQQAAPKGTVPPETTLVREADEMASEQGYNETGVVIGKKNIGYGGFTVTREDGTRFTPQSKQDVVNVMVESLRTQYIEQGTRYIQEGYTPVIDEAGVLSYVKSERQLLSPDYVPERGDVQQYPGGPIVNIPEELPRKGGLITSPEQHDWLQGAVQSVYGALDVFGVGKQLTPDESGVAPIDRSTMANLVILDRNDPDFQAKYDMYTSMGAVPYSEYTGVKPSDIAIGLLSVPQGAFFVSGFKAIPEAAVKILPFISGKVVHGVASVGTMAAGAVFGAKAIKDIVTAPSEQMRNFSLMILGGQIASGMSVSGVRIGGLPGRLKAITEAFKDKLPGYKEVRAYTDTGELRLYRHYEILGRDVRSPFYLKGARAVDLETLVRGYHPESSQMTLENFMGRRVIKINEGNNVIISERLPSRVGKTYAIADIIKQGTEQPIIKPYALSTGIQLKLFPSEKASSPISLTDIVKKTEPLIIPKTKTSAVTFDDLVRGRGEKIWVDEKGNIRTEELEQLTARDIVKKHYSLSDVTRKPLYDLTKPVDIKAGENVVQVLETVKPSRTVRADTIIESPDVQYVAGSPKLLNYLLTLETGIGLSSEHWKDIKPGAKGIMGGRPSTVRVPVSSEGLLSFSFIENRQARGEFNINDVVTGDIDLSDVLQNQMARQNERQEIGNLSLVTPVDVVGLARRSAQRQSLNQRQQLKSGQMLEQVVMLGTESILETPGKLKLPRIPGLGEEGSTEGFLISGSQSRSYIVGLRGRQYRSGKKVGDDVYHKASKPLSKDDATSLGMHVTDDSEKASFILIPSDKKPGKLGRKVQDWRERFLEFDVNAEGAMVEKSLHRIDSPGELRMITMKGIEANMRRHKG